MKTKYYFWAMVVLILATFLAVYFSGKVSAKTELEVGRCQNVMSLVATSHENGANPHPACVPNLDAGNSSSKIIVRKHHRHVTNPAAVFSGGTNLTQTDDTKSTEKSPSTDCHNKNQWKDGTADCNAGKGNN